MYLSYRNDKITKLQTPPVIWWIFSGYQRFCVNKILYGEFEQIAFVSWSGLISWNAKVLDGMQVLYAETNSLNISQYDIPYLFVSQYALMYNAQLFMDNVMPEEIYLFFKTTGFF